MLWLHHDWGNYTKSARNLGRDTPPSFIDKLLDVSDWPVMSMIVEEQHLIEPHTGDDKGAGPCQAFGRAGLEIAGLDNALKEQLDGFAAIGIQVVTPRFQEHWQLLGREQPTAVLGIAGDEGGPTAVNIFA